MLGNLGKMMKLAAEMKTKLPEMQEKLAAAEYTAEVGGGAVAATVNGKLVLADLKIRRDVLADGAMDEEMLADLIKAAVSAAQHQAAAAARDAVVEMTGGMDVPGLGGLVP